MTRSRFILLAAAVALVCLVRTGSARAGNCTALPTLSHTIPLEATNWSYPLITIPKYDSSSGDLCLVVVRLSASLEASIHAVNTSAAPASLTATMHVSAGINAQAPIANFSAVPISAMQTIPVAGMASTNFLAGPIPSSLEQQFTMPGDLAQFVGPGFLNFDASANGSFTFTTNTGNATVDGSTKASAKIEVTYYVPEPSSLLLLAVGLTAVAIRRRR